MRVKPRLIIEKLIENNYKVRKTARDLGISPGTVINWKKRAASVYSRLKLKKTGLCRRSTKPKNPKPKSLSLVTQREILKIREDKGFCAPKIKGMLGLSEHHRTIHRLLKDKGMVKTQVNYRRPLFQDTKHMHAKNVTTLGKLQMDVKYVTPELSGLEHTCYLYAVIDIFSRYKSAMILPLLDQGSAVRALEYILGVIPLRPDFIQTDNGLEFQRQFRTFVETKGLEHHYIHKSNPNENAVIERSFRTDQDEFFYWELRKHRRPKDMIELNIIYQDFLAYYNNERLHLGIELMTPAEKIRSVQ